MVTEDLHTREYSHSNGNWGLTYKVTVLDEKNSHRCHNIWCRPFLNYVRVIDMCTIFDSNSVHIEHITRVYSHRNGNWGLTYKVTVHAKKTSDIYYNIRCWPFFNSVRVFDMCTTFDSNNVHIMHITSGYSHRNVTEDLHTK